MIPWSVENDESVVQDGNWNTIAICDTTGSVGERYAYSAYGAPVFMTGAGVVQSASTIGFETLYAGYRWDNPAPQMYYVRNRFLLPQIGSWNKRDPLGYVDGMGLYVYASDSPTVLLDPLGQIGIFFDGAGQKAGAGTEIQRLFGIYPGKAFIYYTRFWPNNIWANIRAAYKRVCDAVCARVKVDCVALTHTYDPPEPVDIFGWSRGAIAALTLAEKLNTEGCTCRTKCTCTTRDCTSKDGKALFTETTTTFVAV